MRLNNLGASVLTSCIALCFSLTMLCSCSGNNGSADTASAQSADDTTRLKADTDADTTTTDASDNQYRRFGSASEALEYMQNSGNWDKYSQGILPRMAEENLPYCEKLLNNTHPRFIVVDKGTMRVLLYDKYGRKERQYGCACARNYGTKRAKADSRTPEGFFEAEGIYDSTEWLYVSDSGVVSKIKGQFGPRFIRLKCPNTSQIGIHGTCAPGSIGKRCSHGCIRITNDNILDLVKYAEKGMPIIVNPGPRDISVNKHEGNAVTWITVDNDPITVKDYPYPYEEKPAVNDSTATAPDAIIETPSTNGESNPIQEENRPSGQQEVNPSPSPEPVTE